VKDTYNNWNVATDAFTQLVLPYNDGRPLADFSNYMDSVYFVDQTSVKFRVASGNPDLKLYRNDGTLLVDATPIVEITKDGSPFAPTVNFIGFDGTSYINEFTLTGPFFPGEYRIHIEADSIKNYLENGIADTTYTFKVFNIGLSFSGSTHDFGRLHEDYAPITPFGLTVTNPGNVTATGLSVAVTGFNDTAFVVNRSAMTPNLPGNAATTFTVAPKTGLRVDPPSAGATTFTATVELRYPNQLVPLATFNVEFTVFKLPAPVAAIDYINETLINLSSDSIYSINRETPVAVADDGTTPIAEEWMNGQPSTNEKIDPVTGGRSIPQSILIPLRPAAPAGIEGQDAGDGLNNGEIQGVNDRMEYRQVVSGAEAWIPVPAGNRALWDLSPGTYQIRYKAIANEAFSSHILTVVIRVYIIPRIEREITLPNTPGIITTPPPGIHYVASGEDFTFTLVFTGAPPVVKTSRIIEGVQEELTGSPNENGGYTYIIRQIREAVAITIEAGPGGNIGNESVEGAAVWATPGHICIRTPQTEWADIYTVTGLLFRRIDTAAGAEVSLPAPGGVYLIRFTNGEVRKVIVR
jgi:hypothetical protein